MASSLDVRGARTHNLRGVDCRVPHGKVTVVTGLSGAGKSSLAFDTIHAEARRRFVESMSTYARQFMEQVERPPHDTMTGVLPAVALEARNSIRNARSTVGTLTEVHDVLRLLFTHLGRLHCPEGHGPVDADGPSEVARALTEGAAGGRFLLGTEIPRPKTGATVMLRELVRQGFARRLDGDDVLRLEPGATWPRTLDPLRLVLGRFRASEESAPRIAASIEDAYQLGRGLVFARTDDGSERWWGRRPTCPVCAATVTPPTPALFSFNSPLGACDRCQGFGRVLGIDPERVVPDPTLSLREKPIAPWNSPAYQKHYTKLFRVAGDLGIDLDVPFGELPAPVRNRIWKGGRGYTGLDPFFARLERKKYRMHVRVLLARYRSYETCPDCRGRRLSDEASAVTLRGRSLPELSTLAIDTLLEWVRSEGWTDLERRRSGHLLDQLEERLETLSRVGLEYLTLDRQARTLSGGEAQRIQLATALGSGLTSTLYVLDEPTIGLHPRDSERLLALLRDLADRGNTVLVVEHDRTLIEGADHLIDLGPRAGEHGGTVIFEGPPERVVECEESLTGLYLRERPPTSASEHSARFRREHRRRPEGDDLARRARLRIRGARSHNLRNLDVEIPLGTLVAVTGVSGSGKSTLVQNVLHATWQRARGVVDVEPGECDALEGLDDLEDLVLVDQSPLGRSSRSNPVTYVKAWDEIRRIFSQTEEARRRGTKPRAFSFNVEGGRCPACKGTGVEEVDLRFMASVTVPCDVCQGRRFRPEILELRFRGLAIDDVLDLTVERALDVFEDQKKLCRRLSVLVDVGLGYLRLGQATATLSGGEAQRLKLASFLDRPASAAGRLFLFDEPTTGLHFADIDLLHATLRRLVQRGHGVVVVEHSPDLIARAEWIVDLGPGGGPDGGRLLWSGPIGPFVDDVDSPTAEQLRLHLKREPAVRATPAVEAELRA